MKELKTIVLLVFAIAEATLMAQTNTWAGGIDRDWHKACNWSLNIIPACAHDVVIPNTTNKPLVTGIAHCKTVNVQSASGAFLEVVSSGGGIIYVSSTNGGACTGTATDNGGCCTTHQWEKFSNPSTGNETANNLVIDNDYMYVVGDDASKGTGSQQWRIEKRNLSDGNLVTGFGSGGIIQSDPQIGQPDVALTIDHDASGIYVGGYYIGNPCCLTTGWRIEKRNFTTGALITAFGTNGVYSFNLADQYSSEYINDLVTNSTYVYGVGSLPTNGSEWHVRCINATSGANVWNITSNPSTGVDIANAVAVNASGVYIAGIDNSPGNRQWRVEKRNLTSGALITAFGSSGVVTSNPSSSLDDLNDIAIDATGFYVVGYDNSPGNAQWRIEKRNLTTGALITSFGTNGVVAINPSTGFDVAYGVAVYNGRLHVVGSVTSPLQGWGVYVLNANSGEILCSSNLGSTIARKVKANASGVYVVGSEPGGNMQWRMVKPCNCP